MKVISTFCIVGVLFLASLVASAQPAVSYIIPDIGAPGMSTYVEFIGPTGVTGNFGNTDKLFDKDDQALRIEPVPLSDTSRVVVGPLVVSWQGRVVSTQIFVKPNASLGNVLFRVFLNNQPSGTVQFTITAPQTLGVGGNGQFTAAGVLGSGVVGGVNYGTRSPRGAMIVQSLRLVSGANMTVSTVDPDGGTAGNQGYLPFILLSKGSVVIDQGAGVSVNGGTPDAAPGGGGGAGKVCDANFPSGGSTGSNGGAGYTGGGAGGRNGGPSTWMATGVSTGSGGNSLNGALAGKDGRACSFTNPEASGGGTGHPFGTGGNAYCGSSQGGYGGGGGGADLSSGGGGGNAFAGAAGAANSQGLPNGNKQGVPLAGGSGGASSNPRALTGGCGGSGGGGGGAVSIYSQTFLANGGTVNAVGGAGESSSYGTGGGGSGGLVILGSKIQGTQGGGGSIKGGTGGGAGSNGRLRYDGFPTGDPVFTNLGTSFIGPTIDTISYTASRTFTLSGTCDASADLRIWVKGDSAYPLWTNLTVAPFNLIHGRTWTFQVTLPAVGGLYYFTAAQQVNTPNVSQYEREPNWVLSQAATAMINYERLAKINGTDSLGFLDSCQTQMFDTVKVWNSGDANLNISSVSIVPAGQPDFTVLPPYNAPFTVLPGDTARMVIRFAPTTPGAKFDTLVLANNDIRTVNGVPRNPFKVKLYGVKLDYSAALSPTLLDFGELCKDSLLDKNIDFLFTGNPTARVTVNSIQRLGTGPAMFSIIATLPSPIVPTGNKFTFKVRFQPSASGTFADSFRVLYGPCNAPLIFRVKGSAVQAKISVTPNPLAFGDVKVGSSLSLPVTITNTGTATVTVTNVYVVPAGAPITLPSFPLTPIPPGGSVNGNVMFTPTTTATMNAQLCVVFSGTCPDTECIAVTGRGVTSLLKLSRNQIELDADPCKQPAPAVSDTFTLSNLGTASEQITGVSSLKGLVTVTSAPVIPPTNDLAVNGTILFTVNWLPTVSGTQYDSVIITTNSADAAQRRLVVGVKLVRELAALEFRDAGGAAISSLDIGDVFDCSTQQSVTVHLHNMGTLDENVSGGLAVGQSFAIVPAPPYTVTAGGDQSIAVSISTATTGDYNDTLVVRDALCNQEYRLPITGHRYSFGYQTSGQEFNNANVGFIKTGAAFIKNTSNAPNDVKRIVTNIILKQTGTEFALVNPKLPDTLAPGESATFGVSFTPGAVADYNATLCFVIAAPCPDTLCVPLHGAGIKSSILVRQSALDFGTKYVCQDSVLNLDIENTGTAPLTVSNLNLGGADAGAFQQVPGVTIPAVIAPGGKLTVQYRFVPALAATDGLKTATVTIVSDDAAQPSIVVTLLGERRRQALTTPTQLAFGQVNVGTQKDLTVVMENRTTLPLTIDRFTVPPPFAVVSPAAPLTLAPGDSITVTVRFTPTDSIPVSASLVVGESSPCADSTTVPLTGEGKLQHLGVAVIDIPDTITGKAGQKISIPLIIKTSNFLKESGATTFRATLRFNKTMLMPIGAHAKGEAMAKPVTGASVETGKLLSQSIVGNDRVAVVEVTQAALPSTAPDTLGYLDALVLLGDTTTTAVILDSLVFTDGNVSVTSSNGQFTLEGYCVVGGNRLIQVSGLSGLKAVVPNPFNAVTQVVFETNESGPTSLVVYDASGHVVQTLLDRVELAPQLHTQPWDAREFASGIYYVELQTPTKHTQYQVVLVK